MEFKAYSKTLKMIFDKFKKTAKFSRKTPLKIKKSLSLPHFKRCGLLWDFWIIQKIRRKILTPQ
jgi:hypothetical protein